MFKNEDLLSALDSRYAEEIWYTDEEGKLQKQVAVFPGYLTSFLICMAARNRRIKVNLVVERNYLEDGIEDGQSYPLRIAYSDGKYTDGERICNPWIAQQAIKASKAIAPAV